MKFVVEKNALIKALSHVQSIVERKNTLPILSNILIEAKENCIIFAKNCSTEKEFRENRGAYGAAGKNGWLKEISFKLE